MDSAFARSASALLTFSRASPQSERKDTELVGTLGKLGLSDEFSELSDALYLDCLALVVAFSACCNLSSMLVDASESSSAQEQAGLSKNMQLDSAVE